MVYETYETESLVLSYKNVGEGDRLFLLYTRDFGLIHGYAKNIRAEKSKLRYRLQPFSRAIVAVIRGKEYWRIVGASEKTDLFHALREDDESRELLRRLFNLLARLVSGEEKNERLFNVFSSCVEHLVLSSERAGESLKHLERVAVARILSTLGYLKESPRYTGFLYGDGFPKETLESASVCEEELLSDINTALRASHL